MTMYRGKVFDYELFERRYTGDMCAIVTHRDGLDVAYIDPSGSVQWAIDEELLSEIEVAEVERMCAEIVQCNYAA